MAKKPTDKPADDKKPGSNGQTARQQLKGIVERITRLEEEKKAIAGDIKDIYKEAKSNGFDPKALRKIVKESQQTPGQRAAARETEAITDIYRANLGMLDGTPLAPHPDYLKAPHTPPLLWDGAEDHTVALAGKPWPPERRSPVHATVDPDERKSA